MDDEQFQGRWCPKQAYPTRELAAWYRPFRETQLGMTLYVYRCRNKDCRKWKRWHLTSKLNEERGRRIRWHAHRVARFKVRAKEMQRWYDDGAPVPGVPRW